MPVGSASGAGTAGTTSAAGSGGAGNAGVGNVDDAGGTGFVEPPLSDAGTGGAAGIPPQLAAGSCEAAQFSATCDDNCSVIFAGGLRCGGALSGVQVAETALLASFQQPAGGVVLNQPFEFRIGEGLSQGAVIDSPSRGALAHDGAQAIVVAESDAGLEVLPSGVIIGDGGQPLAARSEGGNVYVLAQVRGDEKAKALWTVDAAGEVEQRLVYPDAVQLQFVAGMAATSLVVTDRAVDAAEAPLWKPDAAIRLLMASQETLGAVALADEVAMWGPSFDGDGVVSVSTASGTILQRGNPSPGCPSPFTAFFPDICETGHTDLAPTTTTGHVLAATLAYAKGYPWLVTLVTDVTEQCQLMTSGCNETRPCDCSYRAKPSRLNAALQLTRIDQPATSYRIQIDGMSDTPFASIAASSAGSVADLAVAITPAGVASIGYLLLQLD